MIKKSIDKRVAIVVSCVFESMLKINTLPIELQTMTEQYSLGVEDVSTLGRDSDTKTKRQI